MVLIFLPLFPKQHSIITTQKHDAHSVLFKVSNLGAIKIYGNIIAYIHVYNLHVY